MNVPDKALRQFALSVKSLRVFSPKGRQLLDISSFDARPGECIGIRGPSGAGKSTLLFALAGLHPKCDGNISWNDQNLLQLPGPKRAEFRRLNIGFIFQDFLLFEELTALGNACLPLAYSDKRERAGIRQRANHFLQALGLKDLGREVESFSGGERQRVAIARALSNDPGILLADEPTASLDRQTADGLIEDLVRLTRAEGKSFIAVSHDQSLLSRMDRVIDIIDGRMITAEQA